MFKTFDMDPIDVDPNGICENQTTAGAANLVLNGALCDLGTAGAFDVNDAGYSSGIAGVRIAIDAAGDVSSVVFTVTGTDQDGLAVSEDITGVTTTAVESTTYWKTITQIAADSAAGSDVFVGPVDEIITSTLALNWQNNYGATLVISGVTGTLQCDVQQTLSDLTDPQAVTWVTTQPNKTADLSGTALTYATAIRLVFDSYSSGAELQFSVRQADWQ